MFVSLKLLRRVTIATVVSTMMISCGVPVDETVRGIDSVPFQLMATTTSTTTTTTTTLPIVSTIARTSTTTTTLVDLTRKLISLYFVNGDRFVEERRALPLEATLDDVVFEMIRGPFESTGASFPETAINLGDVLSVAVSEGLATIELNPRFNDLVAAEQRKLVGQLVLTLGSQGGVGQVLFRIDGNPLDVPQGDGTFGTDALSRDSFLSLVDGPTDTATTTAFSLSPDDIIGRPDGDSSAPEFTTTTTPT